MNKYLPTFFFVAVACLLAGCAGEETEESSASIRGALVSQNALAPNALAPDALAPNALASNALAPNTLASGLLAAIKAPTADGDLSRALVKYTVSCALDSTQSFAFSWTDAQGVFHNEVFKGLLGIAPGWATGPLVDDTRQRLVSGCLAARVNFYGIPVTISLRASEEPLRVSCGSPELSSYPHVEGAFWGNLFASKPYLNACYEPANVLIARADSRDCAVGHLVSGQTVPCGMVALRGSCSDVCQKAVFGRYYPACTEHPGITGSPMVHGVVTTALP